MSHLDQGEIYGNLNAYKLYTRPTSRRLYGSYSFRRKTLSKHQENVQHLLEILALNGSLTTWGMAKSHLSSNTLALRTKEKEYRRLLIGRKTRGKKTMGVMEIGLVVKAGKNYHRGPAELYRLSLHGLLYCLDVLDLTNIQIDVIASKYSHVLPYLFGKWSYLKSIIGDDVYRLKILASGLLLDNVQITKISKLPIYEILTYISVKYQNNFEHISEEDLANQISYWFYTHLLMPPKLPQKIRSHVEIKTWKKIFDGDKELKRWYYGFIDEVLTFYETRFKMVKNLRRP